MMTQETHTHSRFAPLISTKSALAGSLEVVSIRRCLVGGQGCQRCTSSEPLLSLTGQMVVANNPGSPGPGGYDGGKVNERGLGPRRRAYPGFLLAEVEAMEGPGLAPHSIPASHTATDKFPTLSEEVGAEATWWTLRAERVAERSLLVQVVKL